MQMMGAIGQQFLGPAMSLLADMGLAKKGVDGVGSVNDKGEPTVQEAKDNSAFIAGFTKGYSVSNPQIPGVDLATFEKAVEGFLLQSATGQDAFGGKVPPDLFKLAVELYLNPPAGANPSETGHAAGEGVRGVSAAGGVGGGGGPGQVVALAALGGLVAAELFEVLSKFAKTQAEVEKMSSEVKLKLQAADIESAKGQAQAELDKAAIAIAALITQMVIGLAVAAIQIGGAKMAMDSAASGMSDSMATLQNAMIQGGATALNSISDKGVEAIKVGMTAPIEASIIMMRAYQQILQQAEQSMDKLGDDAHALLDKTLDMLKQMMSAMMQAFNKIGQ